jgi:hypothetical protein
MLNKIFTITNLKKEINMKTNILKITAIVLVLAVGNTACNKPDAIEEWVWHPEHNSEITITLSITPCENVAFVRTYPQDLHLFDPSWMYLFQDSTRYVISKDILCLIGTTPNDGSCFDKTMLSRNRMKLEANGLLPAYGRLIKTYIFTRKK